MKKSSWRGEGGWLNLKIPLEYGFAVKTRINKKKTIKYILKINL